MSATVLWLFQPQNRSFLVRNDLPYALYVPIACIGTHKAYCVPHRVARTPVIAVRLVRATPYPFVRLRTHAPFYTCDSVRTHSILSLTYCVPRSWELPPVGLVGHHTNGVPKQYPMWDTATADYCVHVVSHMGYYYSHGTP